MRFPICFRASGFALAEGTERRRKFALRPGRRCKTVTVRGIFFGSTGVAAVLPPVFFCQR